MLGRHNAKTANNSVSRRTFVKVAIGGAAVVGLGLAVSKSLPAIGQTDDGPILNYKGKVTQADRLAAAASRPKANSRLRLLWFRLQVEHLTILELHLTMPIVQCRQLLDSCSWSYS